MHHRYEKSNIPIELLRTLVAISEAGSFTKAAETLKLSQSAVSAQIKRLEQLVAGELFSKAGSQHRLTERGEAVIGYARRILALNDQILALAGLDPKVRQYRLGVPSGIHRELLIRLVEALSQERTGEVVHFRSDTQEGLVRGLELGHLDIAFIVDVQRRPPIAAAEWAEQLHWVRSPKFLLSPGAPVPLVSSPGSLSDRIAIKAFDRSGIPYFIAFTSHDRGLGGAAVMAGVGVRVTAERFAEAGKLNIARDHYLPPLPSVPAGIYLREALDRSRVERVLDIMVSILNPGPARPAGNGAPEGTKAKSSPTRRHRS
jgi:DNA-binding transcriptional LysR family regulator